ncbi:MAG: AMP-binding protein, partial [Acidimicrobiia bacterium]|nr:AMP-binding protein [Acidimicrobiia bacterium]
GTVGFALNGVELRITDDDGADVSAGTTGSVEVNGPNVFAGYWQRPDATAESTRQDGWFVTGDVGRLEPDGRLRLEGRSGDMVISGGENIYPREIELILDQIEGIAESAVIGLPDEDLGERVVAVLVADGESPAEAAIRATLGDRLARFKHPRALVWVDELPRNTMGKVQKHRLRDQLS